MANENDCAATQNQRQNAGMLNIRGQIGFFSDGHEKDEVAEQGTEAAQRSSDLGTLTT